MLQTFPTKDTLTYFEANTPKYMHPNALPFAVIAEGFLTEASCDKIVTEGMTFEGYRHNKCGAESRDIGHIPELDDLRDFSHWINGITWKYDLDPDTVTWMQTYSDGGDYQLHMDAAPGRMRKLTTVAFLTDPETYTGGDLEIFFHPESIKIPRTRGTIVIFQPWLLHQVHPVVSGIRQSLNMSFWGPNFK